MLTFLGVIRISKTLPQPKVWYYVGFFLRLLSVYVTQSFPKNSRLLRKYIRFSLVPKLNGDAVFADQEKRQ